MSASTIKSPSPHRRHVSGPTFASPSSQAWAAGGSVPLKLKFNSTRVPRHPPARRRSADCWTPRHATADYGVPLQLRSAERCLPSPASPRTAVESGDLGLQRVEQSEGMRVPFRSNETQPVPPTIVEERVHPIHALTTPAKTASPAYLPTPIATPASGFASSPSWKLQQVVDDSPLERKGTRVDSPLQDAFEPQPLRITPSKDQQQPKPTGKRRRMPSAWETVRTAPPSNIGSAHTSYSSEDKPSDDSSSSGDEAARPLPPPPPPAPEPPAVSELLVPRKPLPIPKTRDVRPTPLTLFPNTSTTGMATATATNTASSFGSLRSGSALAGASYDLASEPLTPTTYASPAGQKLMTEGSPVSLSAPHHPAAAVTTSGWYDDDDGNERVGLMGARKGRRGWFTGLWRGCFGCS